MAELTGKQSMVSGPVAPDGFFEAMVRIGDAIAATIGPACEIAIHDFSDLNRTILHIAGSLTGREKGGVPTDLILAVLRQGQVPDALIGYTTYLSDGRALKSSTIFYKDALGRVFGCMCINVALTDPLLLEHLKQESTGGEWKGTAVEAFANTPEAIVAAVYDRLVGGGCKPVHRMSREEKIELVRRLDHAGVFYLRDGVEIVARLLGVSRTTVYSYQKALNGSERRNTA